MGNPTNLSFEVVRVSHETKDSGKNTIITVNFKSYKKASAARYLLHVSNRNVSSKIRCFYNLTEAEGQEVDNKQERETKLKRTLGDIDELIGNAVSVHDAKIRDVQEPLSVIVKALRSKRGVPFSNFEKLISERNALRDKLQELERQKNEFMEHAASLKTDLGNLMTKDKFDHEMKEIRKAFGVECRRLAAALPIYARRADILNTVKDKQVMVIIGETGSGKSTQMVQYLYQAGYADNGLIACTQPRKIAAVTLATHVASELASSVGQVVGYKVGMQTKTTSVTKVLFMTDYILLNECLQDRLLSKYSCILIDEAHERSIHTDLLLGLVKEAVDRRPNLKVIITSATIEPDIFVNYFGGTDICPVLKVSGRAFPVDIFWDQNDLVDNPFPEDYESKALNKAIEIHTTTKTEDGDVLVFVTSPNETVRCVEKLKRRLGEKDVYCLPLHGKLKAEEQQLVFKRTPSAKRKIVFATNSAETSITIPGIKFVVDTGVVKEMRFDLKKSINSLDVVPVSQSSANQRAGRAGRTSSGICYRLYTENDYQRLEKTASPEILRIQVSQALLKLLELGVDPLMFDYVQSPSSVAMESAMMELKSIGAVDDSGLSELGKWIAKLPIEPRLGVLIRTGIDMEIPTEAVVVASSCNQTGMFFRAGTDDDKNESDINKAQFCHKGGDLLTMLNVYREWDKVQERQKGKWCEQNSINGKVMKEMREIVNEIMSTLKKELKIGIKHQFKRPEDADPLVQRLLFEILITNLGYYLGHEQAGYLLVSSAQRAQIHPSSAILSLGYHPTWVVFCKVLKTSTDFITGITHVPNEIIDEAVESGMVSFETKTLEKQVITLARKIFVGKHIYWKFVGPMHKNRQEVEEQISKTCNNSLIIVDTNRKRGEISLFCLNEYENKAVAVLRSALQNLPQELLYESLETHIGNEKSGVRAVLREGGAAIDILMPNEYRSMKIWQKVDFVDYDITEESIRELFEFYGPVEQIWKSSRKKKSEKLLWGKVTFVCAYNAFSAVEDINNDKDIEITVEPLTFNHEMISGQGCKMKIIWYRRPSLGHCFVYTEQKEDIPRLLRASPSIDGNCIDVSRSKEKSDLHIIGLAPEITVDQVKETLCEAIGISLEKNRDRFNIIIPRAYSIWNSDDWLKKQDELTEIIAQYADKDSFKVHVRQYKAKTIMCTAFVKFSDQQICYDTGSRLIENDHRIGGQPIFDVCVECNSTVHVNGSLYCIVREDLDQLINRYTEKNSSTTLEVRTENSGNIALDIKAVSLKKLAKAKIKVDKIIGGEEINCEIMDNLHVMFRMDGRRRLKEIEKATETLISIDDRQMKIKVQGLAHNRNRAVKMIDDFITQHATCLERNIRLKGEDNPPGLMKALLVKFGVSFESLKVETGVTSVFLEPRSHEIILTGSEDATLKASNIIKDIRQEISRRSNAIVCDSDLSECPVCMCSVNESDIYRPELCGHAYCQLCLASQMQSAVSNREFPILCASENCNTPLVIRDINFFIKSGHLKKGVLSNAAVACLVNKNKDKFRFCITVDCGIVYRATPTEGVFVCPVCRVRICTACHVAYHDGQVCNIYKKTGKGDDTIDAWLKGDAKKRKRCPKCSMGIEKIGGCNHVECAACNAHICWKCLQYFERSGDCYGHMQRHHELFI